MDTFIIIVLSIVIIALILYIIRTALAIREFGSLLKELSSGNPERLRLVGVACLRRSADVDEA